MEKNKITPKEFDKLTLKEQYFYNPFYEKYKKVRKRDYCEECGQLTGYSYEKIGIGKPIGYKYSLIRGIFMPKVIDTILKPNYLIERFLKKNANSKAKETG